MLLKEFHGTTLHALVGALEDVEAWVWEESMGHVAWRQPTCETQLTSFQPMPSFLGFNGLIFMNVSQTLATGLNTLELDVDKWVW
jgi:hypothetical protein